MIKLWNYVSNYKCAVLKHNCDTSPFVLQVTLYSYNWSVDLGASLNRELVRLVKWQNARAHVVHCLFNQKMGLFHHYCFSDAPIHEIDSKQVKTL